MRPGAVLINTSRGEVGDEAALLAAMDAKGIRAGLDEIRDEPGSATGEFTSALAGHPNVVGTHHIGASTQQAQNATSAGTIDVIEAYRIGDLELASRLSFFLWSSLPDEKLLRAAIAGELATPAELDRQVPFEVWGIAWILLVALTISESL